MFAFLGALAAFFGVFAALFNWLTGKTIDDFVNYDDTDADYDYSDY